METMIMKDDTGTTSRSRRAVAEAAALVAESLDGVEVARCPEPDCEICGDALPEAA